MHLIQSELLDEPDFHGDDGVRVQPGQMGENITTVGIDLLSLGNGTKLHFVDKKHTQTAFDGRFYRVFHDASVVALKLLVVRLLIIAVAMMMGYSITWYSFTWCGVACDMVCVSFIRLLYYFCFGEEYFGEHAIITVSGVRHPCKKVDKFRSGLKEKCLIRSEEDHKIIKRKAGIMAVVTKAGTVEPGMSIIAETTWRFKELPVLA